MRSTRLRVLPAVAGVGVAITSLALAGCSWIADGEDTATTSTSAPTATTQPPALEVLDPGAEPRQVLRLRFVEGDSATVDLASDLKIAAVDGPAAIDPPPIVQTVRFDVDRADVDRAEVSFEVTGVTIDDPLGTLEAEELLQLTAALDAMVGLRGTGTIDRRGEFSSFTYDVPDGLDPAVTDALDQLEQDVTTMGVPLPEVPVGLGARWRARNTIEANGVRTEQVTTYEITAIDGDGVGYTAAVDQSSPPQDLPDRNLPAGTTARLLAATARGDLTGTLRLDAVVSPAELTMSGQQKVEVTDRSGSSTTSHDIDVSASVRPAP